MNKLGKIAFSLILAIGLGQTVFGAVYTVTKIADTNDGTCDADCSLREAVAAANGTADNDTIIFASLFNTPQTITLGGTDIIINNNGTLLIFGPGADKLTVSGNNASRVFTNNTLSVATIANLRVTGGTAVSTVQTGRGGGVYNNGGTLTLSNLVLTGNTAANGGASNNAGTATLNIVGCAIFNNSATASGGATQNFGGNTTNIRNSSIYNNTSGSTVGGGAIQANGTVNITNTTISGNTANTGAGGGIIFNGTALNITNSTIVGNTSTTNGGGIHKSTANIGVFRNTIISGNNGIATSPDATGAINSEGNNIIGNIGTSTGWIGSDLQNINPQLSPHGFYGGNGLSFVPGSTSPALNGGQNCVIDLTCTANNPLVAINTDQRGTPRPFGATVDIGAVENSPDYIALLPNANINQAYNQTVVPNIGSFSYPIIFGSFPNGVFFNVGGTIAVSGTPTQSGKFEFGIGGLNGANSYTANYRLYVSPATTSVFGRIVSPNGALSSRVTVLLTSNSGNTIRTTTNPFGYYRFDNANVGEVYQVTAASKIFTFVNNPQFVLANDAVTIPDITIAP